MKKVLLLYFLLFSVGVHAQIMGDFYSSNDIYGNNLVYFRGQNTTGYHYPIQVICVNEQLNENINFSFTLAAGGYFNIGPTEGWYWQPGEKLHVIYANGQSVYWVYRPQGRRPSFGGRTYDCDRCLCKRYEKKSTYNSDCNSCGHPKHYHYSQK